MDSLPRIVRELRELFEEAWKNESPPDVASFFRVQVEKAEPRLDRETRRTLAVCLVRVDLEYRWKEWERNPVVAKDSVLEEYARRVPELGTSETWPDELVVTEYRARKQWGDRPDTASFLARFPNRRHLLLPRLREVDAELGKAETGALDHPEAIAHGFVPEIPGDQILEELGRGGMGVVF